MSRFDRELEVAERAVRAAGDVLLSWVGTPETEWKGRIDPVSEADKEAQRTATAILNEAFPNYLVVGEENTELSESETLGRSRWYLDPLDGTTNYLHNRPHWCVSLAFVDSTDEAACAAVFAPPTSDLFLAKKHEGATCNGHTLQVRSPPSLDRAMVGSGFPYSFGDPNRTNLAQWAAITVRALAVRCSGAAALDLCDVARGRLDAFWEIELETWDIIAGSLVAREAGAITTRLDGGEVRGPATEILAASPSLHETILKTVQSAK